MLEYSLDQAEDLLTKNFNQANLTMEQADTDLDFLKYFFFIKILLFYFQILTNFFLNLIRDQITTTEVNIARVYNWDVKRRKNMKPSESSSDGKPITYKI